MVVVFGWGRGEAQDHGEVVPIVCPRCHNPVFLHEIRSNKQVSLYFVPLASYGTDVYLSCPICRAGAPVDQTHRPAVDSMISATRSFRTGHLPLDAYRIRADGFLRTMGFTSATVPESIPPYRPTGAPPRPGQGQGPASAPAPAAPGAGPLSAAAATPSVAIRITDLAKLHADGILTDDEFAAAKSRLLET
jgi:hypothetical protein